MPHPSQPLDRCPCGADAPYAGCCGRYLDGDQFPATVEALMRSRYVAYVQQRADYLLRTWHSTTQPEALDFSTDSGHWLGLKVIRVVAGRAEDEHGTVEFVARYKVSGKAHRLHEISRFVREADLWVYLNAEVTS
ncbi:MAG: YchJ family protein [Candidatus Contendobacter sp.]|jgi:SEC-C motif-containing protein|nr:YchJ family protein [Gammaproteobacteria bacterium]MCC8993074.1 YchJ family protein [Candidatus Contendobacter sp.]